MQQERNSPSEDDGKAKMLEHTTDVAVLVSGKTLAGVFASALEAMNQVLAPGGCGETEPADCALDLELNAPDPTALLVDFLSECLALTYIERVLFCKVRFERLDPTRLKARLHGNRYGALENEIKAVTYHGADLRQNAEGLWATPLLFDV